MRSFDIPRGGSRRPIDVLVFRSSWLVGLNRERNVRNVPTSQTSHNRRRFAVGALVLEAVLLVMVVAYSHGFAILLPLIVDRLLDTS